MKLTNLNDSYIGFLITSSYVEPVGFCPGVIGPGIGGKYIPIMVHLAKASRWSKR